MNQPCHFSGGEAVPRQAKIWRRAEDGWWYCTHKGKKVKLSQDRKEAKTAFHELKSKKDDEEPRAYRPSFKKLADQYLTFTQQTKSARTYEHQKYFLQRFCDHVKAKKAAELKPADVTAWILTEKTWGHNTQVTARGIVVAVLNWAVEQGHLPYSPLARMKVGMMHGRERILTKEERQAVLGAVKHNDTFRLFLRFLEQTGARPYSEAAQITADMIDWDEGCIPLVKHKNARKGKRRVIYLTDEAKSILRELSAKRPTGPLFCTRYGHAYNRGNLIGAFRRLEEKLQIKRFNPYAYRHTYITEALERGLTADIVAELVGNSPKTIAKYYSHLESKRNTLREAARKAVG
jgi:integrase